MRELHKCKNPLCDRETAYAFCCPGCGLAFDGHYEIHESGPLGHSDECNRQCATLTHPPTAGNPRATQLRSSPVPPSNCFYFLGVDPAPAKGAKSDDGALAALRARPRPGITEPTGNVSDWLCEFIWAYVLRGATTRQWSAFIHLKHRHFGFSGICMDPGGTGNQINDELILTKQFINGIDTQVIPIASHADLERTGPNVQLLLTMFRPKDPGIEHLWPHLAGLDNLNEAMHIVFQEAVNYMVVSWPKPFNERPAIETEGWEPERKWALKTLDTARNQLIDIQVATNGDGTYALTGHSAKQFSAAGKKDLAYACIYAYVRFLVWLKMGELEFAEGNEETEGYYVMAN